MIALYYYNNKDKCGILYIFESNSDATIFFLFLCLIFAILHQVMRWKKGRQAVNLEAVGQVRDAFYFVVRNLPMCSERLNVLLLFGLD